MLIYSRIDVCQEGKPKYSLFVHRHTQTFQLPLYGRVVVTQPVQRHR